MDYYNLDMIISVGYRVNSKRGTAFRIWASNILKDYLIRGYSINEQRLNLYYKKITDLENAVKLLTGVVDRRSLSAN